jgi:hypothetical protein
VQSDSTFGIINSPANNGRQLVPEDLMSQYIFSGMEDPNNPDEIIHSDLVSQVSCEAGANSLYGSPEFHVQTVSDLSDLGVYFNLLLTIGVYVYLRRLH